MEINKLNKRSGLDKNKKLSRAFTQFSELLKVLRKRELPENIVVAINEGVSDVNSVSGSDKEVRALISKTQSNILKLLEKELKIVAKNHYRYIWLAIGIGAFGVPFGVVFGASMDNMGLLGVGIPIGMVIGMAIGSSLDKKAFEEGRQLDWEIVF